MLPDLITVSAEDALDVGLVCIEIGFAAANDIGVDMSHVAKEVEDVESIIGDAESVKVLEIETVCVQRLLVDKFRSPMYVFF